MPDFEIRRAQGGNRREGRRSLSAYGAHARGARFAVASALGAGTPSSAAVWRASGIKQEFSAGTALALVYPLIASARLWAEGKFAKGSKSVAGEPRGEGTTGMTRKPTIRSLETVSLAEATAYLNHAGGDELDAASALAWDRNRLDGSNAAPDEAEVHHALFLLRRARGERPPSFDEMRVELRRRVAA
jgi:hypothetical protein